jgi:hypothetical protein
MSIFVDPIKTFPLTIYFQYDGEGIKILKESHDDSEAINCQVRGRDYEQMSKILEDATVINHISGKPMLRSRIFYKLIILNFFSSWDIKGANEEIIPINNDRIAAMNYNLVKALAKKWLEIT